MCERESGDDQAAFVISGDLWVDHLRDGDWVAASIPRYNVVLRNDQNLG